ncbi:lipid A deacylase LpxR family protein [uncultured Lacinutrix sp.]|uniref:lipid A deacylase LpxR family protein n=1 Tax=uncultured Lacinutrix sp. TaxID=574032 RepID=UPI002625E817|nr:lipid A deacylase LpxR family protein [uncultured Lacinutrix sp.]
MTRNIKHLLTLFLFISISHAQKIDNMVSYRNINSNSYFRFNYENDYFAATDENYTQGYNLELVLESLEKNPINKLFFNPKASYVKYGLSIEHIGFTPNDYVSEAIQIGDRPFSSAIMLKSFIISTNLDKKIRFTSSFNLGLIGPGAFGKEMQVGIHEATGNKIPKGWKNQIKNDVVISYEVGYEKQLYRYNNLIALQVISNLKVGTLFINASVGFNTVFGIIDKPFSKIENTKGFKLYAYAQPAISMVGYDATLQGGIFNNKSPYTISSNNIERLTAQYNYGLILKTKTLYFEYSRSAITREFKSGNSAKYGGIKIGFTF